MKKELSNFKAWLGYQFAYIFDVISFYYVTHETILARGEKILKYQISYKNLPETQVYQNRINLIEDKMTRLENYDKYKKVFFGACLIFICTLCFTIITKPLALLSLIFSYIALISLLCILPFNFLIFFDKAKLKRNLETYKSDLKIKSSICSNKSTTSCNDDSLLKKIEIESDTEIDPTIYNEVAQLKNPDTISAEKQHNGDMSDLSNENHNSPLKKTKVKSTTPIGVLYYILKVKDITNTETATVFKEIASEVFIKKKNGKPYSINTLNNPCTISNRKGEIWDMLDLLTLKLSKYNSNNKTNQVDLNPTIQTKLDYLKSKFKEKGIILPNKLPIDLMLKLYYHHTIEKHEECLKLNDAEFKQTGELYKYLNKKSVEENHNRPKKIKSRKI